MRRFFECLVPNTTCNLKCSYCYLIQEGRRTNEKAHFQYPPEIIGKALRKSRVGGTCLVSLTSAGETLLPTEMPEIVHNILREGHFVNITTNGTLNKQLCELLSKTEGYHQHLHFSFSLHYLELLKHNLLDIFFKNVLLAKKEGCSILIQINLVDEYIPYWDIIRQLCVKKVGAPPQVALTRDESGGTFSIMSSLSKEDYVKIGQRMDSPLFNFTVENFMVKRKEYCYAGYWSANLFLETGLLRGCYGQGTSQNIFEDINKPILFEPIGKHCQCAYCINSSHFISQGIIPTLLPVLSYGELRDRSSAGWYTPEMKAFLFSQFEETNKQLSVVQKVKYELMKKYHAMSGTRFPKSLIKLIKKTGKTNA